MRLSWAATAIVVLAVCGPALARQTDAGPVPAADAGPSRDATAEDSGDDSVGARKRRIAHLEAEVAALEARIAATVALDSGAVIPPENLAEGLEADFSDPSSVTKLIEALRQRRNTALAASEDRAATEALLLVDGDENEDEVWQLRLTALRLEQAVFARQAGLARTQIEYLERTQPAREEAKARSDDREQALRRERERAEEEQRATEVERDRALAEQSSAKTEAEFILSAARAELKRLKIEQSTYHQRTLEQKSALSELAADFEGIRGDLLRDAGTVGIDVIYDRLAAQLLETRVAAFDATRSVLRGPRRPPTPPDSIDDDVSVLRGQYPAEVEQLARLRFELDVNADHLRDEARELLHARAALLHAETMRLTQRSAVRLRQVSGEKRSELLGISRVAALQLRGEALQVVINLTYHASVRLNDLRRLPSQLASVGWLGSLAWLLLKLGLLVLFLRYALRQWDAWMLASLELIGHSLQYGGWSLWLARLVESARHFGPSLLVLGAAVVTYRLLGGQSAPAEIQVAYVFAFWTAALRCQLRVVQSLARAIGQRWRDKRRDDEVGDDAADDKADDRADDDNAGGDKGTGDDGPQTAERAAELFAKTWRRLTRYVAVFIILLELTQFAVDQNVFFGLLLRFAWLGAIPLFIFFLRTWRPLIIREYLKRTPTSAPMRAFTERHSKRFYGLFIVAVAFFVVVVRQIVVLFRDHLSNLESTRRVLAFLFRRRVEKHARDHGRVLERPHDLPHEIVDQFPNGPLDTEDGPVESKLLPKVLEVFEHWLEEKVEGSVVLVGGRGMGRTTTLNLLSKRLDQKVMYGHFADKITDPNKLVATLTKMFGYDLEHPTEKDLINAIYVDKRPVFAIDDCHNLFLRKVGGFEAWTAFTRIVNQTCKNVFWVLTFNDAAWDYLNNISENVAYYRRVFEIPAWSETDLRRMILSRMRRAGYKMNFTDLLVTRLEGVNMSSQIVRTSRGYFRLLWDFTDGNPRLATFFWLRSLVPDPDERRVRVHLFNAPSIDELQALPDDIAFVLTAVSEHENVTTAELATITGFSEEFSRFSLAFCRERGYLTRNHQTGRTYLSFHWQQTIVRFLKRKHLLYS